ncbi:protein kinase family protein [Stieleria varia]|uniref:Protein kinase domain-containing protein n=1 Tax=Stieleria varia TaxID=2528005 RepID=A0A5C5ZZ04_9BACT|nr:hypothetical protein [Stieleria varia]TWT92396.1 hypothetical protein Pla52n_62700 [Stieleria varia]
MLKQPSNDATLDRWMDWLSKRREQQPRQPLRELLDQAAEMSAQLLLDLACVDLIQQRRAGVEVDTESYLQQFSSLQNAAATLDLIDAELCVTRELGLPLDARTLIGRFPEQADAIAQLIRLDLDAGSASLLSGVVPTHSVDESLDFSLSDLASKSDSRQLAQVRSPVTPPSWLKSLHCVASGPGHWLFRGRDSSSGQNMAMKVIQLSGVLTAADRKRVLDLCEQSSQVGHPAWVVPRVAAIEKSYLAVIRPWVFGVSIESTVLDQAVDASSLIRRMRHLSTVAYALHAAHQSRACHGGVNGKNLVIDHDGTVKLFDAASTLVGWTRWLSAWDRDEAAFERFRVQADVRDLVRMIASDALLLTGFGDRDDWFQKLAGLSCGCAGAVGDELVRKARQIEDDPLRLSGDASPSAAARIATRLRLGRFFQPRPAND